MSRIQDKFKELQSKRQKALIAYIMTGYPNEQGTLSAIRGLIHGGADIIELGFPFSDPLADGPTIQNASTTSLNNGTKMSSYFRIIKKIRNETNIPLVLMTYTNILFQHGFKNFFTLAKKAGIDGVILPDMSIDDSKDYLSVARKNKIDTIFLISPNTRKERLEKIARDTSGFLYLVSMYGTTGMKKKIGKDTINAIKRTKTIVNGKIPVGVGFGISTPSDVKRVLSYGSDAVIVGSAFLQLIETTPLKKIEAKVSRFTSRLKSATKKHHTD